MPNSPIVRLVDFSTRMAWVVIALAAALAGYCAVYSAEHFSIVTDVKRLFPPDLPWAERATAYASAFPQYDILAVVDTPSPELTQRASTTLARALTADRDNIRGVQDPQGGAFFATHAFLYVPTDKLARTTIGFQKATPLLEVLASDPSLRGALGALSDALEGASRGAYPLDALTRPMAAAGDTVDQALANKPAHFSWMALANDDLQNARRRVVEIAPILDFKALQPGRAATSAIERTIDRLEIARDNQAQIRLTGLVPMNDAQFATLQQNAALNLAVTVGAVFLILWLALRSWRIILAAAISVACGLSYSAALGLFLVGSLNLISVAFFVLFIGLAVDFAIQFSVRYRAERHDTDNLRVALTDAARKAGWPLALAAAATALGFSSFLPTSYRGLSELGKIAGPGMLIAFLTSVTLLPALLRVLAPPGEPDPMGFSALAPVDHFLQRWRIGVVMVTFGGVLLASPLLARLHFDFNTVHLQDPKSPAVETFLSLRKNPAAGANAVEIVAPNLDAARAAAQRLRMVPNAASARTLADFVPDDQARKLALIHRLAAVAGPALHPGFVRPAPSDRENIDALRSTARLLSMIGQRPGASGAAAHRLAGLLEQLAAAGPAARANVSAAVVDSLKISLDDLREALQARAVDIRDLPGTLKRDWLTSDGRARIEVLPKSAPDDTDSLRQFVRAILARNTSATGPAVLLYEAGNTVVRAFIEAGIFAVVAIAALLWIFLRKASDVVLTLTPLLLAALLTLELCVVLDIPLNFTNIIAFPLLLGVGVAFKIYYIMAWRRGQTALVQSTLTRAVVFSAMTTATAFGSLWLSKHPGTSSMGELMSLALVSTMLAAVFFQPALMGPPRKAAYESVKGHAQDV